MTIHPSNPLKNLLSGAWPPWRPWSSPSSQHWRHRAYADTDADYLRLLNVGGIGLDAPPSLLIELGHDIYW